MEQFTIHEMIDEGTQGEVYKALDRKNKELVAMKKILLPRKEDSKRLKATLIREITMLKRVEHENIVRLRKVVCSKEEVYMCLEYLNSDMCKYMKESGPELSKDHCLVKMFLYQILCGIACCHDHGVVHRDLKPANLLMDPKSNVLKIADFGLARGLITLSQPLSPKVGTVWYMAPEVLLGSQAYSTAVDVWAIGCIFAEMVNGGQPLFEGESEIDQLYHIFRIMGTPNENAWPILLPRFASNFPTSTGEDLANVVPDLDKYGLDLLREMLYIDPYQRITAKAALEHEYFKDIRTKSIRIIA
ncbi:cell division control protein 2 homolog [Rutidosis leptorrhynchoides]|uniref:cell division control protein 2 homolog n=1 Tax=Rutidosis leptorrhynchoides TaxID=125765 RepID=UPI003A995123